MKNVRIVKTQDMTAFENVIYSFINTRKNCDIQFSTCMDHGCVYYCALVVWEDEE